MVETLPIPRNDSGIETAIGVLKQRFGERLQTGTAIREQLEQRGHRVGPGDGGFGGYQAILWDAAAGVYHGASESRKDGHAAGF